MTAPERADAIIQDILVNHLPRITEGLKKGYVDENQVLIVYDHAVRARILRELAGMQPEKALHEDTLEKINRELENPPDADIGTPNCIIKGVGKSGHITYVTHVIGMSTDKPGTLHGSDRKDAFVMGEATAKSVCDYLNHVCGFVNFEVERVDTIQQAMAIVVARSRVRDSVCYVCGIINGEYPQNGDDKIKSLVMPVDQAQELAKKWTEHYVGIHFSVECLGGINRKSKNQLLCPCGGVAKEYPAFPESLLKCEQCGRVYIDEDEVALAQKTESMKGERLPDAIYWTTGTLAGGTEPTPMETEIKLNGSKTTISAVNGKFVLTYEQIVRMAINQRRSRLDRFDGTDAELPMYTCTYSHRVAMTRQWHNKPTGTLDRGQSVECTPGMVISCVDTSNA